MAFGARGKDPVGARGRPGDLLLGGSIGRRMPGPDRRAFVGSLAFHLLLIASVATASLIHVSRKAPVFESYRIHIVSPPPQVRGEPEPAAPPPVAPRIVQAPPAQPPRAVTTKPQVVEKRAEQTPVRDTTPQAAEAKPVAGRNPDPASPGGVGLNVDIQGQEFAYPEYLENIIIQINRYLRWDEESNPTALVAFYINRDGTVGGLSLVERSGNFRFNTQAMSAIELAGRNGAFGKLPDGWVPERLFVRYRFLPPEKGR